MSTTPPSKPVTTLSTSQARRIALGRLAGYEKPPLLAASGEERAVRILPMERFLLDPEVVWRVGEA